MTLDRTTGRYLGRDSGQLPLQLDALCVIFRLRPSTRRSGQGRFVTQTQISGSSPWWLLLIPALLTGAVTVLVMWPMLRKRSWRDWKFLAKATRMPPEHIAAEPRAVRDLAIGEESYVPSWAVVTSKRARRVFISWSANLSEAPVNPMSQFAALRIRRLKRGFSLTIRPGDDFVGAPCCGERMRL